jgi:ribosomal-protein-alanine N-acetyltransferase
MPPGQPLPIRTRRLLLRDFEKGDLSAVESLVADPWVREHAPLEHRAVVTARRVASGRALSLSRKTYELAVVQRRTGKLIGLCDIAAVGRRNADIGYLVNPRHWGHGYGTEIARALVRFGFEALKVRQISAVVSIDNERSRHVLVAAGFSWTGLMRRMIRIGGRSFDCHRYVIERARWATAEAPNRTQGRGRIKPS